MISLLLSFFAASSLAGSTEYGRATDFEAQRGPNIKLEMPGRSVVTSPESCKKFYMCDRRSRPDECKEMCDTEYGRAMDFEAQRGPNIKLEKPGRSVITSPESCKKFYMCDRRALPDECKEMCDTEYGRAIDFEAQRGPNIKLEKPGRYVDGGGERMITSVASCKKFYNCGLRGDPGACEEMCEDEYGRAVDIAERQITSVASCKKFYNCRRRSDPAACEEMCDDEYGRAMDIAQRDDSWLIDRGMDSSGTALCVVVGWVAGIVSIAMG